MNEVTLIPMRIPASYVIELCRHFELTMFNAVLKIRTPADTSIKLLDSNLAAGMD
jgi:hypothetical protein